MKYIKFNSTYGVAYDGYVDDKDVIKFIKHFCKLNNIKYKKDTFLIDPTNTEYKIETLDIPFPDGYKIQHYKGGELISTQYDVSYGFLDRNPSYRVSKIEKWKPS